MDAFITRRGGGGNPLNFTVVGGTVQPSNPKENTIWVNTSTDIAGWAFSAEAPSNPVDGMVWIEMSMGGGYEFDAIKDDNSLIVYPIAVKQYVGGEWISIADAKIYQNGEWKGFILWVFSASVDNTGGWRYYASGSGPTAVRNSDGSYTLTRPKNSTNGYLFRTVNTFTLKPGVYKTLRFNVLANSSGVYNWVGFVKSTVASAATVTHYVTPSAGASGEHSLDISSLDGEFAFAVNLDADGVVGTIRIADVRLEV